MWCDFCNLQPLKTDGITDVCTIFFRYTLAQVTAVLFVTFGVIMATLSSAGPAKANNGNSAEDAATLKEYSLGITLLMVAMVLSAAMGLFQEDTYKKYGKNNWREGLFYSVRQHMEQTFGLSQHREQPLAKRLTIPEHTLSSHSPNNTPHQTASFCPSSFSFFPP